MSSLALSDPEQFLRGLFARALKAVDPQQPIIRALPLLPAIPYKGRIIVVGAGKAAAKMAAIVEAHWPEEKVPHLEGLVITRYGYSVDRQEAGRIEVVEAAHPIPDQAGIDATQRLMRLVESARPDDLLLCLISGGGSALLVAPVEGLSFQEKQRINADLLKSGASIHEMNCLRKHLSRIKGGQLAALAGSCKLVTLAISDVAGDDPAVIASGPTVPDSSTAQEALEIARRYQITLPGPVVSALAKGELETPKPDHPAFAQSEFHMIITARTMLEEVANYARTAGITPWIISDRLEGEARNLAKSQADLVRQVKMQGNPVSVPCLLLSGGEGTVTVTGNGCGGPNAEFNLSLALELKALELDEMAGVYAISCDTDGIDGQAAVAGSVIGPDTLLKARKQGLDARRMRDNNDAHTFFAALDDQVIPGPTLTNVNDFRAILVL